jgi:hypothetical protein
MHTKQAFLTSKKMDWLMDHTACLLCFISIVSSCCKNALGRCDTSSRHITKLEQSRFSLVFCVWHTWKLMQHIFIRSTLVVKLSSFKILRKILIILSTRMSHINYLRMYSKQNILRIILGSSYIITIKFDYHTIIWWYLTIIVSTDRYSS